METIKLGNCEVNFMQYCMIHNAFLCYGPKRWHQGEKIGPATHCGYGKQMNDWPGPGFAPNENYCLDCMDKIRLEVQEEEEARIRAEELEKARAEIADPESEFFDV